MPLYRCHLYIFPVRKPLRADSETKLVDFEMQSLTGCAAHYGHYGIDHILFDTFQDICRLPACSGPLIRPNAGP